MLIEGKVVLVTGAGRGIGASISRVLAKEGAVVAVNYAHSRDKAEKVVAEITDLGGKAAAFQADVTSAAEVSRMVEQVHSMFGRIDGVVNNAINGRQEGSIEKSSDEDYLNAFQYGCMGVIHMVRAVRPIMQKQGGGRIVNIVTELWNLAPENWSVYMSGKGAMVGISRSLAKELGSDNITVNMVAPGWMVDEKVNPDSEGSKNFARSIPLGVHGSADEIGNACVFYISRLAGYITGTYLPVTGGRITQAGV